MRPVCVVLLLLHHGTFVGSYNFLHVRHRQASRKLAQHRLAVWSLAASALAASVHGASTHAASPAIHGMRLGSSRRARATPSSHRDADGNLITSSQEQSGDSAVLAAVKHAKETVASRLQRTTDDVTQKLGAWKQQAEALYGSGVPVGTLTVTVLAATGLPAANPYWVGTVAGAAAETGPPNHHEMGLPDAPRGAPSWSSEPLTLAVHDATADLLLILCDATSASSPRRCIGRIVLPLAYMLPWVGQPEAWQGWAQIFPPAPGYDAGHLHATLAPSCDGVAGSGLAPPATPAQQGFALVRVSLSMHSSLVATYLVPPPFDAARAPSFDEVTGAPILPPERLLLAVHRLIAALTTPPALIRLATTRPWSAGGACLGILAWLLFACPPHMLPWWLLAACTLNGTAQRALLPTSPSPWEVTPPDGHRETSVGSDAERLERFEAAMLPLVERVEAACAVIERASTAMAAFDPRATALILVPLVALLALASAALEALAKGVHLAGGPVNAAFGVAVAIAVVNAVRCHREELYAWLGATPPDKHSVSHAATASGSETLLPRGVASSTGVPHAAGGAGYDDQSPRWLSTERRAAAANAVTGCGAHCLANAFGWCAHLLARLPDAPTQAHREIARAATHLDTRAQQQQQHSPQREVSPASHDPWGA